MNQSSRRLRIFVSSPGDVASARELTAQIIEKITPDYERYFTLEPYMWEYEPMLASGHFQDSIEPPSRFDIVILILESRLGALLPERTVRREYRGIDGRAPITGTEWEFEDALAAARITGVPKLLVYRSQRNTEISTRDAKSRKATIANLEALEAFWSRHFAHNGQLTSAWAEYQSLEDFSRKLETDLRGCLRQRVEELPHANRDKPEQTWFKNPFRGLEPYDFEHGPIFCGRDEAIGSALLRLITHAQAGRPFLLIVGASGSGKSSLVRAGIVPRLLKPQRVTGTAFLRRVEFRASAVRAGEDLFDLLARCLTTPDQPGVGVPELLEPSLSVKELANHLRENAAHPDFPFAATLNHLAERARSEGHMLNFERPALVLVLDQLEELVTSQRVTSGERRLFIQLISALVRSQLVWVIATMRADFWHRAVEIPELIELSDGERRFELLPATPAELSQMIRRPAEAARIDFETSTSTGVPLNDEIAAEAAGEPGALPLLSYVLDQLYLEDVENGTAGTLTYRSYEALGRLKGSIATRAERVLATQPAEVQSALGQVLFALVQPSGFNKRPIARRPLLSDFPDGTPKRRLINALLDPSARLLIVDAPEGASATVRVAHESLITEWKRASKYVDANEDSLRIRSTLEERYVRWRSLAKGRAENQLQLFRFPLSALRTAFTVEHGLLTDLDLADSQRLLRDYREDLAPELVSFVERSLDHDRRRERRAFRAVSAAAVTLLALVALAAVALVSEVNARRYAQRQLETSRRTTSFMVDLFDKSNPDKDPERKVTARAMLDFGTTAIQSDTALRQEAAVRSALLTTMGQSYIGLGLYEQAVKQLTLAQEAEAGPPPISDGELRVRTLVALGTTLFLRGDDKAATPILREAVKIAAKLEPSNILRSSALSALADVLADQGFYDEGEHLCLTTLEADRERPWSIEAASVWSNTLDSLGGLYLISHQLTKAEAPWRQALSLRRQALTDNDPHTADSHNNLGGLYYELGRYAEAEAEFGLAMPVYTRVYGESHPKVATTLNNMARSSLMLGRIEEAETLANRSLSMTDQMEGSTNAELVPTLNTLAMTNAYRGKLDVARAQIKRADDIAHMPDHKQFLDQVLLNEAYIDLVRGDRTAVAGLLNESKELLDRIPSAKDPNNAWRYAILQVVEAGLLITNGDASKAERILTAARPVLVARFGEGGFYTSLERQQESLIPSSNGQTPYSDQHLQTATPAAPVSTRAARQ